TNKQTNTHTHTQPIHTQSINSYNLYTPPTQAHITHTHTQRIHTHTHILTPTQHIHTQSINSHTLYTPPTQAHITHTHTQPIHTHTHTFTQPTHTHTAHTRTPLLSAWLSEQVNCLSRGGLNAGHTREDAQPQSRCDVV